MTPRRARRQVLTLCYVTIAAALRPSLKTRPRTRLQAVASKDVEPLLLCKDIEAKVVENDKAILKIALDEAKAITEEDEKFCKNIGLNGLKIIENIAKKKKTQ